MPRGGRDGGRPESGRRPRQSARAARRAIAGGGAMGPRAGWGCRSTRPRPSTSPGASTRPQRGGSWPRAGAGPVTLGALLGRPASTVGKVLRRRGQSRRPRRPRPPVVRYERASPGELLHTPRSWAVSAPASASGAWPARGLAARARGRRRTRAAYAEVRPSDRQGDALSWIRAQGSGAAVMTDNGPAYRSHAWRQHCAVHDLRHLRTRPARRNASRSCCGVGPMPSPIPQAPTARGPSSAGCGGITAGAPTAPWTASRPSAVSHTLYVRAPWIDQGHRERAGTDRSHLA